MMQPESVDDIVHVIQVALTPVFLLSGVASLLAVFATRLGRVADKVDALSDALDSASEAERDEILARLGYLRRRSHALDAAVVLGALAGVSTSGAALLLFVGTLRNGTGSTLLFLAFGAALVLTIGALTAFLTEMLMASRGIRAIVAAEKAQQEGLEPDPEPEAAAHGGECRAKRSGQRGSGRAGRLDCPLGRGRRHRSRPALHFVRGTLWFAVRFGVGACLPRRAAIPRALEGGVYIDGVESNGGGAGGFQQPKSPGARKSLVRRTYLGSGFSQTFRRHAGDACRRF